MATVATSGGRRHIGLSTTTITAEPVQKLRKRDKTTGCFMFALCFQSIAGRGNVRRSKTLLDIVPRFSSTNQKPDENVSDDSPHAKRLAQDIKRITEISEKVHAGVKLGKKWRFDIETFSFSNLAPDKVPEGYQMVFRNPLEKFANFSIAGAGFMVSVGSPVLLGLSFEFISSTIEPYELAILNIGAVAVVASLYFISLRVPMRIYYSEANDDFLVHMPRIIPWRTYRMVLEPGQLTPPLAPHAYFPWRGMQHKHIPTGRKLLLCGEDFALPVYYNRLMGYHRK